MRRSSSTAFARPNSSDSLPTDGIYRVRVSAAASDPDAIGNYLLTVGTAALIGRSDWLDKERAIAHYKSRGLDFGNLFFKPDMPSHVAVYNSERQNHPIDDILDRKLIAEARAAGVEIIMVTGDHPGTARWAAEAVGILRPGEGTVLTGQELKDGGVPADPKRGSLARRSLSRFKELAYYPVRLLPERVAAELFDGHPLHLRLDWTSRRAVLAVSSVDEAAAFLGAALF